MEVTILTAHLSDDAGGFAMSIPGMKRSLERHDGLKVSVVGVHDPRHLNAWRAWGDRTYAVEERGPRAFAWAPGMISRIAAIGPDVVDAQGLWMYPSVASWLWYRRTGRPYVVTPRGMLDPWALSTARLKKRVAMALYEGAHLRNAACLRATSLLEAESFRSFGLSNPIAVIPNGIDLPDLLPQTDGSAGLRRALFFSRLHRKKGIDVLLNAWAEIETRFSNWELVIAGPDEKGHKLEMQELCQSLRLERVVWHDPVYGREKNRLFRSADLFVLPTRAENFGLVVAEALANEVPVITTRHAPWGGLVQHDCGWWIELSKTGLAATMSDAMMLSVDERRSMGVRGRGWVGREFSWDAIGDKLFQMYSWLTGSAVRPEFVIAEPGHAKDRECG